MSWGLIVRWDNPKHRFLGDEAAKKGKNPDVEVTLTNGEQTGKQPGVRKFKIEQDDATCELSVRVTDKQSRELASIKQSFKLSKQGDKEATLDAVEPKWDKRLDPRLRRPVTVSLKKDGSAELTLRVDLRFLDITEHLEKTDPTEARKKKKKNGDDTETFAQGWKVWTDAALSGATLNFFEYTPQENPKVWAVAIPEAAKKAKEVGIFLFYRPSVKTRFSVPQDADFSECFRYLNPPKTKLETRPDNPPQTPLRQFFGQNHVKADDPYWLGYPNCDFVQQLIDSKRAVVLVFPLPTAGLQFGWAADGHLPEVLDSLIATLRSKKLIGDEGTVVKRTRLALGGYSAGGEPLWNVLAARRLGVGGKTEPNAKTIGELAVDELYLFDPNFPEQKKQDKDKDKDKPQKPPETPIKERLIKWVNGGPDRRLRMIGARVGQHTTMLAIKKAVDKPSVSTYPTSRAYWHKSPMYRKAIQIDDSESGEKKSVDGFASPDQSAAATEISGIYFSQEKDDLNCDLTDESKSKTETFNNATPHELAAIIYHYNSTKKKKKKKAKNAPEDSTQNQRNTDFGTSIKTLRPIPRRRSRPVPRPRSRPMRFTRSATNGPWSAASSATTIARIRAPRRAPRGAPRGSRVICASFWKPAASRKMNERLD
jgi:hypothetical protein